MRDASAEGEAWLDPPPRELGSVRGETPGPTLIAIGGLHGNEPAGVEAIRRVLATLEADPSLLDGEFVALTGNRGALARGRRFVDVDLNRLWSGDGTRDAAESFPTFLEAGEQKELKAAIHAAAKRARGAVFVLDMHTTSGEGPGFTAVGDTLPNRSFAQAIPVPLVLGLEELVDGTLLEYLDEHGFISAVFEIGQHEEPVAAHRGEAGLWLALRAAGLVNGRADDRVRKARRYLTNETRALPRVVEMKHRHSIAPGDEFRMRPGYRNFQRIRQGETLADSREGPVAADRTARILMPLYQEQGEDGFFVVREFSPFWLRVSSVLRRSGISKLLPLLPGVRFRDGDYWTVEIDKRVARFYALQFFHLLGYRKQREEGDRLYMIRRGHDLGPSPEA